MSASFRPISFEAWQKLQLEETAADSKVECLECRGEGEAECSHCGSESTCDDCGGAGTLLWGELSEREKQAYLTYARYAAAVVDDARAWAGWLGRDPAVELFSAGFRVASAVVGKSLVILRPGDLH